MLEEKKKKVGVERRLLCLCLRRERFSVYLCVCDYGGRYVGVLSRKTKRKKRVGQQVLHDRIP